MGSIVITFLVTIAHQFFSCFFQSFFLVLIPDLLKIFVRVIVKLKLVIINNYYLASNVLIFVSLITRETMQVLKFKLRIFILPYNSILSMTIGYFVSFDVTNAH